MASVRSRLQIPRMLSPKSAQYGSGNCGNPPPPPMPEEPCRGCTSKCLEKGYGKPIKKPLKKFFRGPKEFKEKPSNCVQELKQPVEVKLSWWEQIFGPDPKRSFPDPCTCRVAHRHKKRIRSQDVRLDDPRYQETAGDVFLFTQEIKPNRQVYVEPQPKAPPGFKIPKAAMYKMMTEDSIRKLSDGNMMMCSDSECLPIKTYRIPYEEMRPPGTRRKAFSCRDGSQSHHAPRPFSLNVRPTRVPSIAQQYELAKNVKCTEKIKSPPVENVRDLPVDNPQTIQTRSRIEQLKSVLQERDIFQCISSPY